MKIYHKISDLNRMLKRMTGKTVVFTNGVFDIIHPGHIDLFSFAKHCGDILVVGINDDASVKRLKGNHRPIFSVAERMEVLEAIEYIDFIVPFEQDTPLKLIKKLYKIDILIKGGDYQADEVVGKKEVEASGGKLMLFKFKSPYSTSSIIEKIIG